VSADARTAVLNAAKMGEMTPIVKYGVVCCVETQRVGAFDG